MKMENISVTKSRSQLSAHFDTAEARYHIWLNPETLEPQTHGGRDGGPILYKNPPLDQPRGFNTRKLDATPGTASGKIAAELIRRCKEQGLFEKAVSDEIARDAAEEVRQQARTALYFQRQAGPTLYRALELMIEKFGQINERSLGQDRAIVEAMAAIGVARGHGRHEMFCRPKANPTQHRQGVYACNAEQAAEEYALSATGNSERLLPEDVEVLTERA